MKISARNQFTGTVMNVNEGAVNGIVTLKSNDTVVTGTVSMAAIKELGLEAGKEATAIVKATEVLVGVGELNLSARNQFAGTVESINEGAVNGIVTIALADGNKVSATISMAAVAELGLEAGKEAVAIVKATSVMFVA